MISLLSIMPNPTDATSLYRGVGPLQALRRATGRDLELQLDPPQMTWATLKGVDAVFMQRPALDKHVMATRLAKANRKPLWVDYDDDLFRVPRCNPTHRLYSKPQTQNAITTIVARADVITVSTPELQLSLQQLLHALGSKSGLTADPSAILDPSKVKVVPNAYDTDLLDHLRPTAPKRKQNKLVMWRGSGTHDADLWSVTPELCRVAAMHLDWTFSFVGHPFWMTLQELAKVPRIKDSNIALVDTLDPIEFFGFLRETAPALMIVPLEDNPFNRAKSNIAWVEATHAGAVTLAPDWPEWQRPGVINYKDRADFGRKLDAFMRGEIDGEGLWRLSAGWIEQNLTLTHVNRLRWEILAELLELGLARRFEAREGPGTIEA